jgi:hypothetical protein
LKATSGGVVRWGASAAAAAVVAVSGLSCGVHHDDSAPARNSSTPPNAPASTNSSAAAEPASAVSFARLVFTRWSERDLSYEQWWHQLRPMLSPAGQQAYEHTDPQQIPALRVNGIPKASPVPPGEADLTAQVAVPTTVGVFQVVLSRDTTTSPWRLLRLGFPAGVH